MPEFNIRRSVVRKHLPKRLEDDRDVLSVRGFTDQVRSHGLNQSAEWHQKARELVNLRQFFFRSRADERLYIPVPIRVAPGYLFHDTDRKWFPRMPVAKRARNCIEYDDLTTLIQHMEHQRQNDSHSPDHRGIVLLSRSGAGKTVASLKSVFDTVFCTPSNRDDSAAMNVSEELRSGQVPLLADHLPIWLDGNHQVTKVPVEYRIPLLILKTSGWLPSDAELSAELTQRRNSLLIHWLKHGPKWLVFMDLNAVTSEEQQTAIAEGLLYFQTHNGADGHRCVVTYRSSNQASAGMTLLKSEGQRWFGFYDLQPLDVAQAQGYFEAVHRFETEVLGDELGIEVSGRNPEQERQKLQELVGGRSNERDSFISTPLIMHFISSLKGQRLEQVQNLYDLYSAVVKSHFIREWQVYASKLTPVGLGDSIEGPKAITTAMVRIALAILHKRTEPTKTASQANESTVRLNLDQEVLHLPLLLVQELLTAPEFERNRIGSVPEDQYWHGWTKRGAPDEMEYSPYFYREFREDQLRPLMECSLLRWDDQSVGFLHDSFVYFFAGGPALVEWQGPDQPVMLDDTWCHRLQARLQIAPDRWLHAATFLGGAIASYDRQKQLRVSIVEQLLLRLITAPSSGVWPELVRRLAVGSVEHPLLGLLDQAIRSHPGYLTLHPEMLIEQCVNFLAACETAVASFAQVLTQDWRRRIGRKSAWLRRTADMKPCRLMSMTEHRDSVDCIAVLSDGRLASGSSDHTLKLWNPVSGSVLSMSRHNAEITAVAVFSDGRIVSGSGDGTVKLWDPVTDPKGNNIVSMNKHTESVTAMAVFPDGRIVSGSCDHTLKLWNPLTDPTGKHVLSMNQHKEWVTTISILPDGRIVSASLDETVKLWDPATGCVLSMRQHTADVYALVVCSDGRIASGSYDCTVKLWNPNADPNGHCVVSMDEHSNCVCTLAEYPDGRIVSGSWDNTVKLWNPVTGGVLSMNQHNGAIRNITIHPDGWIISGSSDHTVKMWNPNKDPTAEYVDSMNPHLSPVNAVAVDPDGWIVSGGLDNTVKRWYPNGNCTLEYPHVSNRHSDRVFDLEFYPDGRIVSCSKDNTVKIWNPDVDSEGRQFLSMKQHSADIYCLRVFTDGRIVLGCSDGAVKLWNPASDPTGDHVLLMNLHTEAVLELAFFPDGRIVSGSFDGTVKLWNPDSDPKGDQVLSMKLHSAGIVDLEVFPDGRIVSGSSDHTVKLWSPINDPTGKHVQSMNQHTSSVTVIKCLSDGRIVSGSWDKAVKLWDSVNDPNGTRTLSMNQHGSWITALAVISDERIVSGSNDGIITIWDPDSDPKGHHVLSMNQHANRINSVAILPGGRIMSASWRRIIIYDSVGSVDVDISFPSTISALVAMPQSMISILPNNESLLALATRETVWQIDLRPNQEIRPIRIWDLGMICAVLEQ